ncbi:2''-aminoglycoside nucleotidyltransferase [Promicromonospora umidemergens]|uniref:Aminoglycoside nucleotidyltransferase n=1 Tax=Promicromonospora umidemergens TaxID=629679 RepID=A0ABP8X073_9MICO|nr:hypothetical protein [Promicromonospora umidemergens]MCP2286653.1 2''-aminoglycoside nucleotidyltransferase [Promicromonospora umidemergens]
MTLSEGDGSTSTRFFAAQVLSFLELTDALGVDVWLDGGWAVDAHLGHQTREHGDIDIVLRTVDEPALRQAVEADGFADVWTADQRPCNFVMAHPDGRRIDFHLVDFDADGNGLYDGLGPVFPAKAFTGRGAIAGREVRCIEALTLIDFHTGYDHDADDVHDVTALCAKFGQPLPKQYR